MGLEQLDPTNEASLRQDPAGLLPPAVPMARARESCPARAACSGHPAQARAAKAQSPPWVEVSIWASWVTGPSWSQWPSQGLGPQSGLAESQRKSAERVWGPGCVRLAWKPLRSEAILLGDLLEPRSLPIFSPKMDIVAYPPQGAVGRIK